MALTLSLMTLILLSIPGTCSLAAAMFKWMPCDRHSGARLANSLSTFKVVRRKPRIRRSDAGGLNRRILFEKGREDQNPKIADDDGIVNRVLGPVETTD